MTNLVVYLTGVLFSAIAGLLVWLAVTDNSEAVQMMAASGAGCFIYYARIVGAEFMR